MNEQAVLPVANLMRNVIKGYCKYPEDCTVRAEQDAIYPERVNITAHPHISDYPRLIGKGGRFVRSMADVVKDLGDHRGQVMRYVLKDAPFKGAKEAPSVVDYNPTYDLRIPWEYCYHFLELMGAEDIKGQVVSKGQVKTFNIRMGGTKEIDEKFIANLGPIFAGFGHFQGVGDIDLEIIQPVGGGSRVEGGTGCVLGAPAGKEGLAPC